MIVWQKQGKKAVQNSVKSCRIQCFWSNLHRVCKNFFCVKNGKLYFFTTFRRGRRDAKHENSSTRPKRLLSFESFLFAFFNVRFSTRSREITDDSSSVRRDKDARNRCTATNQTKEQIDARAKHKHTEKEKSSTTAASFLWQKWSVGRTETEAGLSTVTCKIFRHP